MPCFEVCMSVGLELSGERLELSLDGRPRAVFDDLTLTVWGERHRLAHGGLEAGAQARAQSTDEIGPHEALTFGFTTRSVRQPTSFQLAARLYEGQPLIMLELLPHVSQPVFGQEEAASLRLGALPGCARGVYVHQR